MLLSLLSNRSSAAESTAFREDLAVLWDEIQNGYAPLALKAKQGIDLQKIRQQSYNELGNVQTIQGFHRLIQRLIAKFADSHFVTKVDEKRVAYLGFETDFAEGKVVVTAVSESLLDSGKDMHPGDEIICFDCQPVSLEIERISAYIGKSSPLAVQRYAAMMLGRRYGDVVPLQAGRVVVGIRRAKRLPEKCVELEWAMHTSNEVPHPYHGVWESPIALPTSATVVEAPSTAYVCKSKHGTLIGFLRIPSFMLDRSDLEKDFRAKMEAFTQALEELEQKSDVLILDATFNDGGSLEYAEAFLALFMTADFSPIKYRFLANEAELKFWKSVTTLDAQQRNLTFIPQQVEEALRRGNRLTQPVAALGQATVPGRGAYTKPVVLLTNEFAASAADAFCVYMKCLERATLLGETTMRAGSHARDSLKLPNSGIRVKVPKVLFCQPDGSAIENVGAIPAKRYSIRIDEDIFNGYSGLRARAWEAAETLVR